MARKMPTPANDPKRRGKKRGDNIDKDPALLERELELQKQDDSTDEENNTNWVNIRRILRAIPRDNPNDPFKAHSSKAIRELAEGPRGEELLPAEEKMLQHYGYDLDRCTILDKPNPTLNTPEISKESQAELNRFPAWLRTFIESKYDKIHKMYGYRTHVFLRMLATRLEYQKSKQLSLPEETEELAQYIVDEYDDEDDYNFLGEDVYEEQELKRQNAAVTLQLDPFRPTPDPTTDKEKRDKNKDTTQVDKETETKLEENASEPGKEPEKKSKKRRLSDPRKLDIWSPMLLQKAGDALRASLVAGDSETEDEDYYEEGGDEAARKREREKGAREATRHKDEEFVYRGTHWEAIVAEKSGFQEEAKEILNQEFMRPELLKSHRKKKRQEALDKRKAERKSKKEIKKAFEKKVTSSHPLLRQKPENQRNAAIYRERGVGKRPSRIFFKSPCDGPIVEVERNLHQTRSMEAMRAYANWIAASNTFKYFIMIIIVGNAALLAFETGESRHQYNYAFDMLDSFFLSIYFAEFLLKFFAYPNQYFLSGFNSFDFIILIVSLVKSIADWLNVANFEYLRFLTIVRALRILRGVSLSIHIQVLVRALLDTLRNHVVSVVLLLILLMYITSIVAFYLYGSVSGLDGMFGRFDRGMLRLFAFVTMDGWTTIMDSFKDVDKLHEGRLFCLILIVLGNFLFSNIFIAIIIMQISDATDSFRKTRADERDIKVSTKQEEVFRRQKLDMRQLLARQRLGVADDFYELGCRFVRRLRHDDLVDRHGILFSPLWMDSLYKAMQRSHHTSNIIMNQHRKMADRLIRLSNLQNEGRLNVRGLSRARYNRYFEIKSKLRLIKEQFLIMRGVEPRPKTKMAYNEKIPVVDKVVVADKVVHKKERPAKGVFTKIFSDK